MSDASKIETNGVNPVPDNERYGRPFDLFPVWFSWNISIFGITLGIYVFGLGLSVWQAMLAGVIGYFLLLRLGGHPCRRQRPHGASDPCTVALGVRLSRQ